MRFDKTPTTIEDQITLLISRGMIIDDLEQAERWLMSVSYYRLSAYWLPFEEEPASDQTRSKKFIDDTNFSDVIDLYTFDRKLRLLVMEAVERVEVAVRARWTYHMVHHHGAHAHYSSDHFIHDRQKRPTYWKLMADLKGNVERSDEAFIRHYLKCYPDPDMPPLWAVTELLTFGSLSMWVGLTKERSIVTKTSRDLGLRSSDVLKGILQNLSQVRNKCAHHSRLWNRRFPKRIPVIRQLRTELSYSHANRSSADNRLYNTLVVLIHLLRHQASDTTFPERLADLIETRTLEQQANMGFPDNWAERESWKA